MSRSMYKLYKVVKSYYAYSLRFCWVKKIFDEGKGTFRVLLTVWKNEVLQESLIVLRLM